MSRMPNFIADIEAECGDLLHRHHHQAAPAARTETTMSKLADVQHVIAEIAANPLVARLDKEEVGTALTPEDVAAVVGIARTLEAARQAQQPLPQRLPVSSAGIGFVTPPASGADVVEPAQPVTPLPQA